MTSGLEQRMAALATANRVRIAKSRLRAELKAKPCDVAFSEATTILAAPTPPPALRVEELLRALPAIGPEKARKLCVAAGVQPTRRLTELSARQRAVISRLLAERKPRTRAAWATDRDRAA